MRIIFQHLVDFTNEEILQRKVNLMFFYIADVHALASSRFENKTCPN